MKDGILNEWINIGERFLNMNCLGQGSPTVVFEAGFEGTSSSFAELLPEIATFTRVVSYDRAGLGQSDPPISIPRTCQDLVDDLHSLLVNAHIEPPYVLVGQSWSGYIVRLFASQYPEEVVGMVLIDCSHEDKYNHFEKVLSAELIDRMWAAEKDPLLNNEKIDRMTSYAQVRAASQTFDFPLIVLTRGLHESDPNSVWPAALYQIEVDLQGEFLKFSSKSKQIVAERSGHVIQIYQPELVIEAIREIVETAHIRGDKEHNNELSS